MTKGNGDSTLVTQNMLQEAVDAILTGMENMQKEQREERRKEIDELRKEMKVGFTETREQIENLDEKITVNDSLSKGRIKMIKATSVSREEFEELKEEVHRLKKSYASG